LIFACRISRQLELDIGEIEDEEKDKMAPDDSMEERQRTSSVILSPSNASFQSSLELEPSSHYIRGSSLEPIHPWR